MEKLGIDWRAKKAEFEDYLKLVEKGQQENLYDPRRAHHLRPASRYSGAMSNTVLIVGGGPAGLARRAFRWPRSASRLCCREKEDRLVVGADSYPVTPNWCPRANGPRTPSVAWVDRVVGNDLVTVMTDSKVDKFDGEPGAFTRSALEWPDDQRRRHHSDDRLHPFRQRQQAGMGFRHLRRRGHDDPGRQMISSGQGVRCPSDGRKPKRVAILLCVGSRDRQIGREWCSRKICCTVSANMAMEIREELPDCHVYIYYMDIRTFGLYETGYYWRSQEEFKVKYIKARIAEVTSDGDKLIVKGEDTLVKRPITIPFDMVVHGNRAWTRMSTTC